MKFKLQKPDLSKIDNNEMIKSLSSKSAVEIFDFLNRVSNLEYLYWDKMQYKEPSPKRISKELLWKLVKFFRKQGRITPILDKDKKPFAWSKLDCFEEFFHELDMHTGGELFVGQGDVSKVNKQKLITRGIMEEAIASSQLEGAATSRQAAKKMLREGRKPVNESEQMVVNNYHSMKAIEDDYKDRDMSMDLILELHGLITKNTIDSQGEKPRLRKSNEPICVSDEANGDVYHEGPNSLFIKKELQKMINFANDRPKDKSFTHPVIKAIMLHFWIGYLHPFTDGNGRLARLLFYWYLIKKNYWAFTYLPISKVIKKSPKQYIMAYIYSEQDGNDMTYFLKYNMDKIKIAVEEFRKYIKNQSKKNTQMNKRCEAVYNLNIRQVQLLQYLHGNMDERTTLGTHVNINQVARMTASKDLKSLVKKGFLTSKKRGRYVYYYGTKKIKELF
ncbi:MAG: Fic family protein [Patescibacteria group bacterium]|nr:Fic family protein [Patescibacteria group bacterium]